MFGHRRDLVVSRHRWGVLTLEQTRVSRGRRRAHSDERGAVNTLEAIILMPLLLVMLFGLLQVGIRVMAVHMATTAAEQGLHAVRIAGGTAGAGEQRVHAALDGAPFVRSYEVDASRGIDTASITVSAAIVEVVPLVPSTVAVTRSGPVEDQR